MASHFTLRYGFLVALLSFWISAPGSSALAQPTAFSYQGRLDSSGAPASGSYDFTFTLFNTSAGGTAVAGPITNTAVAVSNGLFRLLIDFSSGAWDGSTNWLEIGVRSNGGTGFTTLAPRQLVSAVPYAIAAANLTGTLSGGSISNGTITLAQIAAGQVVTSLNALRDDITLQAGTNVAISVNTNGGTNRIVISASGGAGGGSGSLTNVWFLSGNTGTRPGLEFVGTIDYRPLEFHVNSNRALRLEPGTVSGPNVIGGSAANQIGVSFGGGAIGGGATNQVQCDYSTIGGGLANLIQGLSTYSSIGGGTSNSVALNSPGSTIGGGTNNTIQTFSFWSQIGGGSQNTVAQSSSGSTLSGGILNFASGLAATVSGGTSNVAVGDQTTVAGGSTNQARGKYSTVGGGTQNTASDFGATVGGGQANFAKRQYDTVGGGTNNVARGAWSTDDIGAATIAGGKNNSALGPYAAVGGGAGNTATWVADTVSGGYANLALGWDVQQGPVDSGYATVGGGLSNSASAIMSFVGGGTLNQASARNATVSGGFANGATNLFATVGRGYYNRVGGEYAVIGGGNANLIPLGSDGSVIVGGTANSIAGYTPFSSILGGQSNAIVASQESPVGSSTVAGGFFNVAAGYGSFVTGLSNTATNRGATVMGGEKNIAGGFYSVAAGYLAQATNNGAFVWSDGTLAPFSSTADHQFLISAAGGVGINNNKPAGALDVVGSVNLEDNVHIGNGLDVVGAIHTYTNLVAGGSISTLGGISAVGDISTPAAVSASIFVQTSDRAAKEHLIAAHPREILERVAALPISTWNFKSDPQTRHIGPMAQDFKAAFGLGTDDRHIATVDEGGVALAAIQGLNERLTETQAENARLRQELDEIKRLVRSLQAVPSESAGSTAFRVPIMPQSPSASTLPLNSP